ncbi:hypothetical protein OIU74_015106 [Salix koriyanagi]|uniref:Uncharacterized protein n=1 Tax=Salix koriyanagi TaxID=2511006 RepID=A0A9Q0T0G0_9ROSI|nr:hypothetical protein OIU74_015106 [Salix koriyanagi]
MKRQEEFHSKQRNLNQIWHIATDLCSNEDQKIHSKQRMSKSLPDYMFYLLGARKKGSSNGRAREARITVFQTKQEELEDAIAISIDTTPTIPGAYGSSKNLLVHGCELAQQLQKLETEKWKMTSEKAFMFWNRGSMFPQVKSKKPVNLLGVGADPPNPNCMRANRMQF